MVELVLLGLLGVAVTWGVVEWVRDDDDGDGGAEPEPQEPAGRDLSLLDDESLVAGGGDDTITGGTADDLLGTATLRGGAGDDLIEVHAEQADIDGNRGDDTIRGTLHGGIVRGGPGDDTIAMTIRDAAASGGEGDDAITAVGHNATLAGGAGNDTIDAGDLLAGTVRGNEGDDLLIFDNPLGEEAWRADGGEGDDTLRATLHNSAFAETPSMTGGAGEDLFDITFRDIAANFRGDDPVLNITDFTQGEDLLRLDIPSLGPDAPAPSVFLREAEDGSGTHVVVEYLATEHYNDDDTREVMIQDRIWLDGATGLTADDIEVVGHAIAVGVDLTAADGATLQGGAGDDRITAPDTIDSATVQGGAGDDLIELAASNSLVHGNQGDDTIRGSYGSSEVRGGQGDDDIRVTADSSIVMGNDGDDLIVAEAGSDATLGGGAGNDTLDGAGASRSMLHGEDGDDLLIIGQHIRDEGATDAYGGEGDDTLRASLDSNGHSAAGLLHGGAGQDLFDVDFSGSNRVPFTVDGNPAPDVTLLTIGDFTPGEDVLQLDVNWQPPFDQPDLRPTVTLEEGENGTALVIGYPGIHDDGDGPEAMQVTNRIWLSGATGLTLDDIQINMPPPYAGDDSLSMGEIADGHINVGPGSDRVVFFDSLNTTLEGGAGNDTLIAHASDGDFLRGGAGDDVIHLTPASDAAAASQVRGSLGDDTLHVTLDSQSRADDAPDIAPILTGGEGADTFEIDLQPRAASAGAALPSVHITDFDPAEDQLVIDPHDHAGAGLTYQSIALRADAAGGFTDVVLTYAVPGGVDGADIQQEIIRVAGPAPLPLNAITIAPAA